MKICSSHQILISLHNRGEVWQFKKCWQNPKANRGTENCDTWVYTSYKTIMHSWHKKLMLRNKRGRKWKLVKKLLQTTELFLFIAPCTLIPCNKYVSENISDLQAHKQLKCLNVPYLANKIAWNITHFLFSSLVHGSSHCACPHIPEGNGWQHLWWAGWRWQTMHYLITSLPVYGIPLFILFFKVLAHLTWLKWTAEYCFTMNVSVHYT